MKKLYLDTNIYLDYLENRKDKLRPLGDFAFNLIRRAVECEFKIVISDVVIKEIEGKVTEDTLSEMIKILNRKLIRVESTEEQRERAGKRKTHFTDALHAIIAINNEVDYFITRNITDFSEFKDELKVVFPESL